MVWIGAVGEEGTSLAAVPLPAPLEDGVVAAVDVALVDVADDEAEVDGAGVEVAAAAAALSECRTYFAESLSISSCSSTPRASEMSYNIAVEDIDSPCARVSRTLISAKRN